MTSSVPNNHSDAGVVQNVLCFWSVTIIIRIQLYSHHFICPYQFLECECTLETRYSIVVYALLFVRIDKNPSRYLNLRERTFIPFQRHSPYVPLSEQARFLMMNQSVNQEWLQVCSTKFAELAADKITKLSIQFWLRNLKKVLRQTIYMHKQYKIIIHNVSMTNAR